MICQIKPQRAAENKLYCQTIARPCARHNSIQFTANCVRSGKWLIYWILEWYSAFNYSQNGNLTNS
nr:MAG TPA: hypothetical protein [Caudoviricetes sp.]DAV60604.1 MAG TPA: hypothetical protein [Caudoviricetes sp.]